MKKTNRVLQCFIAIALICACVLFTLTACNPNEQTNTPNNGNNDTSQTQQPSDKDDDNDDTTQTPSSGSEDNDTPSTPSDDDDEDNSSDTSTTEKSEAEYKVMFYEKLPTVIEEYFNENLIRLAHQKISNVEVQLFNNVSGAIYFNCTQQGIKKFMLALSNDLLNSNSYKQLNDTVLQASFTTDNNKGVSVQEADLAQEIFDYALEQQEVIDYLAENGIDKNELKLLNATEFINRPRGNVSTLTILSDKKVLSINLGGITGACSTQQAYLDKLKSGRLEIVEIVEISDFEELKVVEDEA
ncbi:MAG: hypothetical protein HDT36_01085 [Clostridiales bacterium]|nr:hypothetical protein [Clostridiales bacterium]